MASKHATISDLFLDIASSIREKKKNNSKIVADNFPDEIRALKILDSSDGTIKAEHVLEGKVGYAKDERIVGTLKTTTSDEYVNDKKVIKGSIETIFDEMAWEYVDVIALPKNTYLDEIEYIVIDPPITYLGLTTEDGATHALNIEE